MLPASAFLRAVLTFIPVGMLLRICVIGLVWLLIPGLTEAAENVWHVATAGHSAHSADAGADHAPDDDEHGCTGTFHLCTCCHSAPVNVAPVLSVKSADDDGRDEVRRAAPPLPTPFLTGFDRPPRA